MSDIDEDAVPKVVEKKEPEKPKDEVPSSVPQMDEYSAMLAYTQDIKQSAGIQDSYTSGMDED